MRQVAAPEFKLGYWTVAMMERPSCSRLNHLVSAYLFFMTTLMAQLRLFFFKYSGLLPWDLKQLSSRGRMYLWKLDAHMWSCDLIWPVGCLCSGHQQVAKTACILSSVFVTTCSSMMRNVEQRQRIQSTSQSQPRSTTGHR